MNRRLSLVTILLLATLNAHALTNSEHNATKKNVTNSHDVETEALELKGKKLSLKNSLLEEKLKREHAKLLMELQKVKWEKELLTEKLALKELKAKSAKYDEELKHNSEIARLEYDTKVQELKNKQKTQEIELKKAKWELDTNRLKAEVEEIEARKSREQYASATPKYFDNPLTDNNTTLIISDRRISLNGIITKKMSTEITNKINYFNNKDSKKPIFIVIDSSPGGSVMAGYLILKAMKSSKAPIYVVLRSYAASMAAIIVTLADKSFAYGHAIILHHQPSNISLGNLSEQQESVAHLNEWWLEFAEPIAKKMGITVEEFKKEMYAHAAGGDWQEMAKNAQKLHWIDNIIDTIVDTSVLEDPSKKKKQEEPKRLALLDLEVKGEKRGEIKYRLPKLDPSDIYFIYDPDGRYRQ